MINTRILLAISMLTALLLVGCGNLGGGTGGGPDQVYDAHTGSQGVEMKYVQDYPPSRVYYSQYNGGDNPVNVMTELWNRGAHTTSGTIYLSGFDSEIIRFNSNTYTFSELSGKTSFNPEGGYDSVEFEGQIDHLPEGMDSYNAKMILTNCYQYQTFANPLVCVDPQPYSNIPDKACTVKGTASGRGPTSQGAPVAVTAVEEEATANSLFFRIQISNVGGGNVIDPNSLNLCPYTLEYRDLDKIQYQVILGGEGSGFGAAKCEPSEDGGNVVRLIDGSATVYCTFPLPTQDFNAYETPLNVQLTYGYKKSVTRNVEIKNID